MRWRWQSDGAFWQWHCHKYSTTIMWLPIEIPFSIHNVCMKQCTNTIHIHSHSRSHIHAWNKQTNNECEKNQSIVCEIVIISSEWNGWCCKNMLLSIVQHICLGARICLYYIWLNVWCFFIHDSASTTNNNNKEASCWICLARLEWICDFPTKHTARRRRRRTFCLLPLLEDLSDFLLNIQQNRRKNCVYSLYFSNCHSLGNP